MKPKKIALYFQMTPIKPRWDIDIWYFDGSYERKSDVSEDEVIEIVKSMEMRK